MRSIDVLVVGAGLAGLTSGLELATRGHRVVVLEARPVVGGRTSSWAQDGMPVESGLHRVLGFYRAFPDLLRCAGIDIDDIVFWEDEVEIRLPDGRGRAVLGAAPLYRPLDTALGAATLLGILSPIDLVSLPGFLLGGLLEYFTSPGDLDRASVVEKARSWGVTERAIRHVLVPLTTGLFFLPPEQYSSYALFGTLGPYLPQLLTTRVGAFRGGMTDVLTGPLAAAIGCRGGRVYVNAPVTRLLLNGNRVAGVEVRGRRYFAAHVVVATGLVPAQRLVRGALAGHPWFRSMLRLPSMPSVTIQIELDAPSMDVDHTTFGPETHLASFAEQSRTTFRGQRGRISIILTPPQRFLGMADRDIFDVTLAHADRLGLRVRGHVRRYRVVRMPADFYALSPGNDALRPPQSTPVAGLSFAGDYTCQQYLATMEGAVVSGRLAAAAAECAACS